MKTRMWIVAATIALSLFATFSRWLMPPLARHWDTLVDPKAQFGFQTTLLGILFAILTAGISALILKNDLDALGKLKSAKADQERFQADVLAQLRDAKADHERFQADILTQLKGAKADQERFCADILAKLKGAKVRLIGEHEFYKEFLDAVREAKTNVRISYFNTVPPTQDPDAERRRYYDDLVDVIKAKKLVKFHRLVRDTSDNRDWILSLMSTFKDITNFSLAVIRDQPDIKRMGLALSVQTIDEDKSWAVAVQAYQQRSAYRDLAIQGSNDIVTAMGNYYDRIWQHATALLEGGVITADGKRYMAEQRRLPTWPPAPLDGRG